MAGLPDISSIDTYGGALNNAGGVNVVDPTTDRDAAAANQAYADISGATKTVPRAWARVDLGAALILANPNGSNAVWGNANPPTIFNPSTGVFTVTWPTTVVDELGNTHTINFTRAVAVLEGSSLAFIQCSVTSANVVTLYTFNTSFAANNLTSSFIAHVVVY